MVRVRFHIYFKSVQRKILHIDSHDKMAILQSFGIRDLIVIVVLFPPQVFA
jgi:hypothetical protein